MDENKRNSTLEISTPLGEHRGIDAICREAGTSAAKIKPALAALGLAKGSQATRFAIENGLAELRRTPGPNLSKWGCAPFYTVWSPSAAFLIAKIVEDDPKLRTSSAAMGGRDAALRLIGEALESASTASGQCGKSCAQAAGCETLEDLRFEMADRFEDCLDEGDPNAFVEREIVRRHDGAQRQLAYWPVAFCPMGIHRNLMDDYGAFTQFWELSMTSKRKNALRLLNLSSRYMESCLWAAKDPSDKARVIQAAKQLAAAKAWAKRYSWSKTGCPCH